ncbi:hypothetical protein C8R43DRAFT_1009293 [Mycena crocata]|nr:hypothetical protein C8R43DRAFT_1009293 [Mycena crocata]
MSRHLLLLPSIFSDCFRYLILSLSPRLTVSFSDHFLLNSPHPIWPKFGCLCKGNLKARVYSRVLTRGIRR